MNRARLLSAVTSTLVLALAAPALATAPPNDDIGDAISVSGVPKPAPVDYNMTSASKESGEAPADDFPTIWFKWTPAQAGATKVSVPCGPSAHHRVRAFRVVPGLPVAVSNLLAAEMMDGEFLPEQSSCIFRFRAAKTTAYYLQIANGSPDPKGDLTIDQDTSAPGAPGTNAWGDVTGPDHTVAFYSEPGARFICSVDQAAWALCKSPLALELAEGKHGFQVKAIDAHGNIGPATPPKTWMVDATAPETTITGPARVLFPDPTLIEFAASEAGTAACSLDGGAYAPCTSPYAAPFAGGTHTLRVKATDAVGNTDATPAETSWVIEPSFHVDPVKPGNTNTTSNTTTTTTVTRTATPVCTLALSAPKRTTRAKLRKGLKVTLSAAGAPCTATVAMKQRGRRLASRRVTVAAGTRVRVALKTKAARRGSVTVAAGALKRTVKVG